MRNGLFVAVHLTLRTAGSCWLSNQLPIQVAVHCVHIHTATAGCLILTTRLHSAALIVALALCTPLHLPCVGVYGGGSSSHHRVTACSSTHACMRLR
jgi:hypothetical protein